MSSNQRSIPDRVTSYPISSEPIDSNRNLFPPGQFQPEPILTRINSLPIDSHHINSYPISFTRCNSQKTNVARHAWLFFQSLTELKEIYLNYIHKIYLIKVKLYINKTKFDKNFKKILDIIKSLLKSD